jgi:hypothetical protein
VTVWQIQNLAQKIKEDTNKRTQIDKELEEVDKRIQELEQKQINQSDILSKIEELREEINGKLVEIVREKERTEAALNLFDEKSRHREVFHW